MRVKSRKGGLQAETPGSRQAEGDPDLERGAGPGAGPSRPAGKKVVETMGSTASRKKRKHSLERIYDLLMNARQSNWVTLHFLDGEVVSGAIIFNEYKGTGRIINVEQEFSRDFKAMEIRDVKL